MMPNNKFNDYPKFGVWSDAYYMTDNQFNQAGTQFLGAGLFAFDRTKMIAGNRRLLMFILIRPKAVQPPASSAVCYRVTSTASRRRHRCAGAFYTI